ncbi:hypothetical protein Ahy_B08g091089 [Arachis hypogaea]|uniref:DUF4283 domain-containing protein n=1 Tax=Arachis hypogaea TaxID=3818 RepID=A0A444Y1C9_ARAHY|nr:hypothetical protein Ahy_B08g091089 [Arachis hypogaea]
MVLEDYIPDDVGIDPLKEDQAPLNHKPTIDVLWRNMMIDLLIKMIMPMPLFEGPWMIADHYLLVQRWRPLFIPHEMDVQNIAEEINEDQGNNPFGPWMIMKKNPRRIKPKAKNLGKKKKERAHQSRFQILAEENQEANIGAEEKEPSVIQVINLAENNGSQLPETSKKLGTNQTARKGNAISSQKQQQKQKNPIPIIKGKNTAI